MRLKTQIVLALSLVCCSVFAGRAHASGAAAPAAPLLDAINAARTAYGLRPLQLDPTLVRAARFHTDEMLRSGTFAHGAFETRMLDFHVRGPVVGENLAWGSGGYAAPGTIVREWLASPEHRANLLRPGFSRVGLGELTASFHGFAGANVVTADFAGS